MASARRRLCLLILLTCVGCGQDARNSKEATAVEALAALGLPLGSCETLVALRNPRMPPLIYSWVLRCATAPTLPGASYPELNLNAQALSVERSAIEALLHREISPVERMTRHFWVLDGNRLRAYVSKVDATFYVRMESVDVGTAASPSSP